MASWSKLPSNDDYIIEGEVIKGTCGKFGECCKGKCFGCKGNYHFKSVQKGLAKRTKAMRENKQIFELIQAEMKRKRKPYRICRINAVGELESSQEFT